MQPVSGKERHTSVQLLLFITNTFYEEETILNQLQHNDELLRIWNNDLNQTTERLHH